MGTCHIKKHTVFRLEGAEYVLKKKIDDNNWQIEHTKNGRIITIALEKLLSLYINGELKLLTINNGICSGQVILATGL